MNVVLKTAPTFWQNLQKVFFGMGIGGIVVGIACLL